MTSTPRHVRMAAALAGVAGLWLLALALAGVDHSLLYFLPATLVALPLVVGRFPGEEAIERVVARARDAVAPPVRPRSRALPARHRRSRRRPVAGGALLASRLAGRAPPCAA